MLNIQRISKGLVTKISIPYSLQKTKNVGFRNNSTEPISMAYAEFPESGGNTNQPPLIIMHGLLGSKVNFRGTSKALSRKLNPNRKIFTLDARNHGESPHSSIHNYKALAADIEYFFRTKNIKKAIIMGHSMGGRAMMYFALTNPHLVDRALILDISPIGVPQDSSYYDNIFSALLSASLPKGTPLAKLRQMVETHLKKKLGEGNYDFFLQNLKKLDDGTITWAPNLKALKENINGISTFSTDEILKKQFEGPTLFIGGKHSGFIKQGDWRQIRKIFPNSELKWMDCGHLVHFEKPQEFLEHVSEFINRK